MKKYHIEKSTDLIHYCPNSVFYFLCDNVSGNCSACPQLRFQYDELIHKLLDDSSVEWLQELVEKSHLLTYPKDTDTMTPELFEAVNEIHHCFNECLVHYDAYGSTLEAPLNLHPAFRKWAEIPGNIAPSGIVEAYQEMADKTLVEGRWIVYLDNSMYIWPHTPIIEPNVIDDVDTLLHFIRSENWFFIHRGNSASRIDAEGIVCCTMPPNRQKKLLLHNGFQLDPTIQHYLVAFRISKNVLPYLRHDYFKKAKQYHPNITFPNLDK